MRFSVGSHTYGVETESNLFLARRDFESSFTRATQPTAVFFHVDESSVNANPSKSKSIPANLLSTTSAVIKVTISVLDFGSAIKPERTFSSVPSVIVGSARTPRAVSESMTTAGFAPLEPTNGVYRSVIRIFLLEAVYLRVYQKGITSLM